MPGRRETSNLYLPKTERQGRVDRSPDYRERDAARPLCGRASRFAQRLSGIKNARMRRIETSHNVVVEPSLSSVLPQACQGWRIAARPATQGPGYVRVGRRAGTSRDINLRFAENSTAGKGISSFSLAPARAPFTSTSDTEADVSGRFMRPAQAGGWKDFTVHGALATGVARRT